MLDLLGELIAELSMSLLIISHDLGVIASISERTLVMNAGKCMEQGETERVLRQPTHPYTQRLIAALPRPAKDKGPNLAAHGQSDRGICFASAGEAFGREFSR